MLAQIAATTKGCPELIKSGLSLSISDTNPERATNKIAQVPSMPRKISPSHFLEVRGFLAALVSAAGSGGSSPGTHGGRAVFMAHCAAVLREFFGARPGCPRPRIGSGGWLLAIAFSL
jgi:hypothetical protein